MVGGCRALLSLVQRPRPLAGGAPARSPIEKFFGKCRALFCGSTKGGGKDDKHPHVDKINRLSGLFYDGWVHAGIYALVDMWDKSYDMFFKFCKSPSEFGKFSAPHLRHEIAEMVAYDKVYYEGARADPVRL